MAIADLFPTKTSAVIFISYMGLFINQGLLVTASKNSDGTFPYNATTAVLITELIKLIMALVIHLKESSFVETGTTIRQNMKVFGLYFVPATLYAVYNNLAFFNLGHYDPTTYFILLQLRVVVTGVIFQVLFGKQLSRIQWASLLMLMLGCVVKNLHFLTGPAAKVAGTVNDTKAAALASAAHNPVSLGFDLPLLFILFQVFASCFAGVYNEFLIKSNDSVAVPLMLQNVFMYVDSIIANAAVLVFTGKLSTAVSAGNLHALLTWKVLAIMLNNALVGIVTSLFLRSLNSVLKTFASGLELVFTAILAWIFFGIRVTVPTWIAIFIVSSAIYLYSNNPVHNPPPKESHHNTKEEL